MSDKILDELLVPGRTLVFGDDTEIAGKPLAHMQADLRLLISVEMASERYPPIAKAITARCKDLGVSRFHATDVAVPKSNSEWSKHSEKDRLAALIFLAGQFKNANAIVSRANLPKGQFPALRKDAEQYGKVGVGFKLGLKRVFVRRLLDRLEQGDRPAMIVLDREKAGDQPFVEHWPEASFLVGGGPITAPSALVPGLQLADLAAWSVNRFLCHRDRFDAETATDFDKAAMRVVASMGNLRNLIADEA